MNHADLRRFESTGMNTVFLIILPSTYFRSPVASVTARTQRSVRHVLTEAVAVLHAGAAGRTGLLAARRRQCLGAGQVHAADPGLHPVVLQSGLRADRPSATPFQLYRWPKSRTMHTHALYSELRDISAICRPRVWTAVAGAFTAPAAAERPVSHLVRRTPSPGGSRRRAPSDTSLLTRPAAAPVTT